MLLNSTPCLSGQSGCPPSVTWCKCFFVVRSGVLFVCKYSGKPGVLSNTWTRTSIQYTLGLPDRGHGPSRPALTSIVFLKDFLNLAHGSYCQIVLKIHSVLIRRGLSRHKLLCVKRHIVLVLLKTITQDWMCSLRSRGSIESNVYV